MKRSLCLILNSTVHPHPPIHSSTVYSTIQYILPYHLLIWHMWRIFLSVHFKQWKRNDAGLDRGPNHTLCQQCCDCESPKICISSQRVASWGCGNNTAAKEREWQYQDIPSHSLRPLPEEFSSSIQGEDEEVRLSCCSKLFYHLS